MNAPSTESRNANGLLEQAAGGVAGQKHKLDSSANVDESKRFSLLQAKFALIGHTLYRTVNPDGSILYLAGRWGYFREIKGLEAVATFLAVIGGVR